MLCDDGKTGSIPIQPVDATEYKRNILRSKVPGQPVGKGILIIFHRRVDGHIGRLVQYHQILIFINDMHREGDRRDFF